MSWAQFFADDEELGKRDDDFRPGNKSYTSPNRHTWKTPFRIRRRRTTIVVLAILGLWLFMKGVTFQPESRTEDLPELSTESISERPPRPGPGEEGRDSLRENDHYYDGPARLVKLGSSLRSVARYSMSGTSNRHVVFAAANLKSVSKLLPIACEMARWNRNKVHVALQGRNDVPSNIIQENNGIGAECKVVWHDARPDHAPYSTDHRFHITIAAGLSHMNYFIEPQVIVVDDSDSEDPAYLEAVESKLNSQGKSLIKLPADAATNLQWLTRLDSRALTAWDSVDIEILIPVSVNSLGNLKRLLRSIKQADYFNSIYPRITIELSSDVSHQTSEWLRDFTWPPDSDEPRGKGVSIRHRIATHFTSSEESSVRFFEAFYPSNPQNSHVFVLSPEAQLSPLYFHYLKYALLEYGYGDYRAPEYNKILGLSLDVPSTDLNGTAELQPPVRKDQENSGKGEPELDYFLWQAPSDRAVLYFGSKWVELHDFLQRRLEAEHIKKATTTPRQVASHFPPWIDYLLEFMRLKNYHIIYPAFCGEGGLVTTHNELSSPMEKPDDPRPPKKNDGKSAPSFFINSTNFLAGTKKTEPPLTSRYSLLSLMLRDGDLPTVQELPMLSFDAQLTSFKFAKAAAKEYARKFRKEVGDCEDGRSKRVKPGTSAEFFCSEDDEEEDFVEFDTEATGSRTITDGDDDATDSRLNWTSDSRPLIRPTAKGDSKGIASGSGEPLHHLKTLEDHGDEDVRHIVRSEKGLEAREKEKPKGKEAQEYKTSISPSSSINSIASPTAARVH